MTILGGYGREAYGDPMGGGGPISVVRARAIRSHVVRVVFSGEPVHDSPSGASDALNPSNYVFALVTGTGGQPQSMSVDAAMVSPPAVAVGDGGASDERGFDVHVDRPLVLGLTFSVTVHSVAAFGGGALGAPFTAGFPGVMPLALANPPPRKVDYTDIQNSPFGGAFVVDDSGDLAVEASSTGLRKRMLRRATTPRGAFSHLPNYGAGLRLKKLFSPAELQGWRDDLRAQLRQEPEVDDAQVTITNQPGTQVVVVVMRARTKRGVVVDASARMSTDGVVVP